MNWTYHPELLATPVPRYTSYPTAAEFHERVGSTDMAEAIDAIRPDEPVSLYLHIPYCRSICWYCGCNTGAANRVQRLDAYLDSLEAEIALMGARLARRGRIGRIAFGGGSPNAIPPARFERLVAKLHDTLPVTAPEISVEIDPRGFTDEWADTMARCGVTRASLGVQTFSPAIQKAIGRVQPLESIAHAVALLRQAGVTSLNFDLMYGLPAQTLDDLAVTIRETIWLGADRVALFGYAHVPHLIPRQRRIDATALPGAAERFGHAAFGHERLTQAGYEAVGFDHFALPGDALAKAARNGTLQRNFQGFTDDDARVLIGLGASAISAFPDRLLQNEKNSGRYQLLVGAGRFPVARGLHRGPFDRAHGKVIQSLLAYGHAILPSSIDLAAAVARTQPFVDLGLARWEGRSLRLVEGALPYRRSIAALFDEYRTPDARRFSNAV